MKKKIFLTLLAFVCALCCAFGLAACGGGDNHEHEPKTEWSYNAEYHWHYCKECTEQLDFAEHNFNEYEVCTACGCNTKGFVSTDVFENGMRFRKLENENAYQLEGIVNQQQTTSDIVIPNTVNGLPVISVFGFGNSDFITSVVFPDSVIEIESSALRFSQNLTTVTLGSGITSIDAQTFEACSALETVNFNSSDSALTQIGESAFERCFELKSLTLPNSVKTIGNKAFADCIRLGNIDLNDGLEKIGDEAFERCNGLESLVIPDTVIELGQNLFGSSNNLKSFVLGKGLTEIPNGMLKNMPCLESLTIPFVGKSATATTASAETCFGYIFGTEQFSGSSRFTQYYAKGESVNYYKPSTLTSVTITGGNIVYGALSGLTLVEEIVLPETLTEIGEYAFAGCPALKSIIIPDSVQTIGKVAFENCIGLKNIVIGKGLKTINEYAFGGCAFIESVFYNGTANEWANISFNSSNPTNISGSQLYCVGEWEYVDGVPTVKA